MVDAGEVYAQIDEAASTVRFLQDPEHYDSASVVQRLDSQMKRAMALGERIRAINNKVTPTSIPSRMPSQRLHCLVCSRVLKRHFTAYRMSAEIGFSAVSRGSFKITEGYEWLQISCDKAYLNKAGGKGKQSTWEDQADLALGRDLGGEMSYSFNA